MRSVRQISEESLQRFLAQQKEEILYTYEDVAKFVTRWLAGKGLPFSGAPMNSTALFFQYEPEHPFKIIRILLLIVLGAESMKVTEEAFIKVIDPSHPSLKKQRPGVPLKNDERKATRNMGPLPSAQDMEREGEDNIRALEEDLLPQSNDRLNITEPLPVKLPQAFVVPDDSLYVDHRGDGATVRALTPSPERTVMSPPPAPPRRPRGDIGDTLRSGLDFSQEELLTGTLAENPPKEHQTDEYDALSEEDLAEAGDETAQHIELGSIGYNENSTLVTGLPTAEPPAAPPLETTFPGVAIDPSRQIALRGAPDDGQLSRTFQSPWVVGDLEKHEAEKRRPESEFPFDVPAAGHVPPPAPPLPPGSASPGFYPRRNRRIAETMREDANGANEVIRLALGNEEDLK